MATKTTKTAQAAKPRPKASKAQAAGPRATARATQTAPSTATARPNVWMIGVHAVATFTQRLFATAAARLGLFVGIILPLATSQLSLWWKPAFGVYVNAVAFAALTGIALWREVYRKLAISAAILPVVTMVILSLPQSSVFAEAVVFYDALLLMTLVYRFWFAIDEPVESTALSVRGYGTALPLMMVLGQVLGVIGYGMLRNHYAYRPASLPLVAVTAVVFAIAEEMFFRGLIQQRAAKVMQPALAAALSALLYALASITHGTWLTPLFALLMGAVLSFVYWRKQNLLLTITVNAMSKLAYIGLLATFVMR